MPVNWEAMHGIIDYSIENKDGPGLSWEQFLTKHKEAFDGFCKGKSEIALHQLLDRSPHTLRAFAWNLFLDKLEHYYGWATPES